VTTRPGDRDALRLPSREVGRVGRLLLGQPDLRQVRASDLDRLVLAAALDLLLRDGEVAHHRHVGEEVELLEHHPDARAQLVDVGVGIGDLVALDEDLAAGGGLEHVDAAQQRRLARARGPDDADDLALTDVEVDALEHLVVAEVLVEVLHVDRGSGPVGRSVGGVGSHQRALSARLSMRRTTIDSGTVISR
jgi:hypothetical protein